MPLWSRDPQADEPEADLPPRAASTQKCFLVAEQDPKKENLFYWKRQRYWVCSVDRGCVTREFRGDTKTSKDRLGVKDAWGDGAGGPQTDHRAPCAL